MTDNFLVAWFWKTNQWKWNYLDREFWSTLFHRDLTIQSLLSYPPQRSQQTRAFSSETTENCFFRVSLEPNQSVLAKGNAAAGGELSKLQEQGAEGGKAHQPFRWKCNIRWASADHLISPKWILSLKMSYAFIWYLKIGQDLMWEEATSRQFYILIPYIPFRA